MYTFLKAQLALIAGSIVDFGITYLLVSYIGWWYVPGNALGNIAGAIAQFGLSRNWAFHANNNGLTVQLLKFVLMWTGNILLSALGIFVLTNFFHLHYMISKLVVSILLGVTYTFVVSKRFVFVQAENDFQAKER